jgi:6,7-dimethyl-8-ribityllumazine synthase
VPGASKFHWQPRRWRVGPLQAVICLGCIILCHAHFDYVAGETQA